MTKNCKSYLIAFVFLAIVSACNGVTAKDKDRRCPELIEKAEKFNAQAANEPNEGQMGMQMRVEYVDSVYRIIQIIDESIIPIEQVKMFYGNIRPNVIATMSSSRGKEREYYQKMVDYRVTFEHIIKAKSTGDNIVKIAFTPDEIAEVLSHEMTRLKELNVYVNSCKNTLPREVATGCIMKDISCTDVAVNIVVKVDESIKKFDEITQIKQLAKVYQAVTLADMTTGLTFHNIVSKVPVGINYHFVNSKGNDKLTFSFSGDEVVKFDKEMKKICEQQNK